MTTPVSIMTIGAVLYHAPLHALIVAAVSCVAAFPVVKLAWKGKSVADVALEDAIGQGAGGRGNMSSRNLIIRPGWALAAITADLVLLIGASGQAWSAVRGTDTYITPTSTTQLLLRLGAAMGFLWFWQACHRKATEPANPKRLPLADVAF